MTPPAPTEAEKREANRLLPRLFTGPYIAIGADILLAQALAEARQAGRAEGEKDRDEALATLGLVAAKLDEASAALMLAHLIATSDPEKWEELASRREPQVGKQSAVDAIIIDCANRRMTAFVNARKLREATAERTQILDACIFRDGETDLWGYDATEYFCPRTFVTREEAVAAFLEAIKEQS